MVNTKKNPKKSSTTRIAKKSRSGQKVLAKEKKPRKVKAIKSPNIHNIAMSKQMVMNIKSAKRISKCKGTIRAQSNGIPMPSLRDLEKMFEDSDSEDNSNIVGAQKNILFSNNSIDTISCKNACDVSSPKESSYDILLNAQQCVSNPQKNKDKETPSGLMEQDISVTNILPHENRELYIDIEDSTDSNSSGSNKTIEYSLPSNSSFCPLPSTSTDRTTIFKNDELFFESLKKLPININNYITLDDYEDDRKANNNIEDDDCMIIESEIESNKQIINDTNSTKLKFHDSFIKSDHLLDNVLLSNSNNVLMDKSNITVNIGNRKSYDDECMIITIDSTDLNKHKFHDGHSIKETSKEKVNDNNIKDPATNNIDTATNMIDPGTNIIDIPIDVIDPATNIIDPVVNIEDKIIDVDALIAQNESTLAKYQHSHSNKIPDTSLVVDVSLAVVNPSIPIDQNQPQSVLNRVSHNNRTLDHSQSQDHLQEVIFISETGPTNLRNNQRNCPELTETPQDQSISNLETGPINTHSQTYASQATNLFERYKQSAHKKDGNITSFILSMLSNYTERLTSATSQCQLTTNLSTSSNIGSEVINSRNNTCKRKRHPTKTKNSSLICDSPTSSLSQDSSRKVGDCPICMDTFLGKIIASTICGHVFCMECLSKSIKNNKRCPTCRKFLKNKSSYHQIFL